MPRMKQLSARLATFQKKFLCLAVAAAFSQTAFANPIGASVASGSASFSSSGNTLTVTNSPSAIINWQQFNIGRNETTRFVQQSTQSAVMNRIGGQNASQILGTLQSNGRVFLINPNGIVFGQGAVIDVAGLVASSLNLSDANFLANKLTFSGGGLGAVSNLGNITTPLGGSVYLIGNEVSNQGVITSPQGQVLLAAGSSVSLIDSAGPELSVTLTASGNKAINLGTVSASGGHIDMFGALIEQTGVLRADSATVDAAGRIVLKASDAVTVSGEISATNSVGAGGTVQVLGDKVTLASTAKIDVSGVGAGGTALIGGDYQGRNAAVQNATQTTIAAGATIKADGLYTGSGGKVIVWADDKTVFDGFISARGGANGGDGGFVETSGHRSFVKTLGMVNTLAPKGKSGTWLLDPAEICIETLASSCFALHPSAIVETATSIGSALNANGTYALVATDYIDILSLDLTADLTRIGTSLSLTAPYVLISGSIDAVAGPGIGLNLAVQATGSSASFGALSGWIEFVGTSIDLGDATSAYNLKMKADNHIRIFSGDVEPINVGSAPGSYSSIHLSAPVVEVIDTPFFAGTVGQHDGGLLVEANTIIGQFTGAVAELGIKTYSSGFNIYLGKDNAAPECGINGLCLTTQFTGGLFSVGEAQILAGSSTVGSDVHNWAPSNMRPDGDIFIGYGSGWNIASQDFLGIIGRNVTINPGESIDGSGWGSSIDINPLGLLATKTFNNLGDGVLNMPAGKYWLTAVGNFAGSRFGNMLAGATVIRMSGLSSLNHVSDDGSWTLGWPNTNIIVDFGTSDLCTTNPASCVVAKPVFENSLGTRTDTTVTGVQGAVTYAADLNIASLDGSAEDPRGQLTFAADSADATKTAETAGGRQEARAIEERKSPTELRREALEARAAARKFEDEAKRLLAESRRAEAEAKQAESEYRKAEAAYQRADAEAKKAEAPGRQADVEAQKYDNEARQAANEVRDAKSPVTRADAESKQAAAESKRADAESRKTDADGKQVVAEGSKSEAEGKKAVVDAKYSDARSKKIESDSKLAEADSKKAEAEFKLALASAKEARNLQQKASAVKRAEEKRIEAIQKKGEANVKRLSSDAKKAEGAAKQAEAEHKRGEAHSKKTEAASKRAESDSRKAESRAKKSEFEGKTAESHAAKAKQDGKSGEKKKAEAQQALAAKKQAEEQKKADAKKAEAEAKQAEAEKQQQEAEARKAEAAKKQAEAERKQAEFREKTVKSFAGSAVAAMAPEKLAESIALRHAYKTETLKPALTILERNPAAASLPACGSGGGDVCIPARAISAEQVAQQVAQLPKPRIPSRAFLPQIERKIAVVIAINNYQDKSIPSLDAAVPDGVAVAKLMQERLGYDVRLIRDAGRADIVRSLNAVGRDVGPNDSVTVYFAGHGYQMADKSGKPGEGFWIPADGSAKEPGNWISNSDISRLLANIPARQVLLVSDSCYSGAFTKEQKVTTATSDPARLLTQRSVVVMSSGGEEPVSDEGKDGHSIFAWSLMNALRKVDKFDSGGKLHEGIRKQVIEDFPQVPQYGAAPSAGHVTGGDYLFEARGY